jgi:N6-adenosine-specific RNA methylase IME4
MSGVPQIYDDFAEALRQTGLTKADLARAAEMQPAGVRRLLRKKGDHNATLATLTALADALGHDIRLVPRSDREVADSALLDDLAIEAAENLRNLADAPFSTVLADPPWRFQNRTGKVAPEHRRLSRYDTMSLAEVCALPVSEIVAENAHLYLWVPNALIADGLRVMEAWGFTYKSNIVWAKRRKDGGPDGRGVGFYFRNTTELILFGVKGRMRTLQPGRRQVNIIETRKREHSRKPDELYPIIEDCSPGPYLEMFARYSRPCWTSWGIEADEEVEPRGKQHPMYQGGRVIGPQQEPLLETG